MRLICKQGSQRIKVSVEQSMNFQSRYEERSLNCCVDPARVSPSRSFGMTCCPVHLARIRMVRGKTRTDANSSCLWGLLRECKTSTSR